MVILPFFLNITLKLVDDLLLERFLRLNSFLFTLLRFSDHLIPHLLRLEHFLPQRFSLLLFNVREPSVIVQYFLIDFFELFHSLGSVHRLILDLLVQGAPDLSLLVESVLLLLPAQLLLQ